MKEPLIWQSVMERFPKLDKERNCRMEREMRNQARESYYQKLLNEANRAKGILEAGNEDAAKTSKEV
jgi:hypothetical protein